MATFFISASNRWSALYWKGFLQSLGQYVYSDWHDHPLKRTSELTDLEKFDDCKIAFNQLKASEYLLVVADPDMVPGGKFVDVGLALGLGKTVILVGRRENLRMHNPGIIQVETPEDVHRILADAKSSVPCPTVQHRNCCPVP